MLDWLRRDPAQDHALDIGGRRVPVVVRRLAQARRLTMRLAPDGSEIRISIPRWTRTEEALAFARSRQDWLTRQIASLPAPVAIGDGRTLHFRGEPLTLRHDPALRRRPRREAADLHVGGPETSLAARLQRWLQDEAREACHADLAEYCAAASLVAPPLGLSNARRRWGSCASNGMIRINWRLIMAPDLVRRSVVAHEVAHLVHFDHSPAFHRCLAELFEGSIDEANRWLKEYGRELYLPFG